MHFVHMATCTAKSHFLVHPVYGSEDSFTCTHMRSGHDVLTAVSASVDAVCSTRRFAN